MPNQTQCGRLFCLVTGSIPQAASSTAMQTHQLSGSSSSWVATPRAILLRWGLIGQFMFDHRRRPVSNSQGICTTGDNTIMNVRFLLAGVDLLLPDAWIISADWGGNGGN